MNETSNLFNFLNTLFSIEVSIFSIISAVVLVFIQLVYSNYSYKHISHILKNPYLILFFLFSITDLLLTSIGSYVLSISDSISSKYTFMAEIIQHPLYSLICLLMIFISISFFVILIIQNITYLQPHRAIFLLTKNIQYTDIQKFLYKKYGLEAPHSFRFRKIFGDVNKDENQKSESKIQRKKREEEEGRKKKLIDKQIEKIMRKVANVEDPLLPIRDMMIQFIRRGDMSSLEEAKKLLLVILEDVIRKAQKISTKDWSPDQLLLNNFTKYFSEIMSSLLEVANKEKFESAQKIILDIVLVYGGKLIDEEKFDELYIIERFLKQVADESIENSPKLFHEVIEFYQSIGNTTFALLREKPDIEYDNKRLALLDEIFRSIGWLGERLLKKIPIEDSPLMSNYNYRTKYDAFLNCLLEFGYKYSEKHSNLYPLIYFDALYVVLKQLAQILRSEKNKNIDKDIYSIVHTVSSFADKAITIGNAQGVYLAALRIQEFYDEIKTANLDDMANQVLKSFVKIGIRAAGNKEQLPPTFISKPLHEWIADILVSSSVNNIESEILDGYLHMDGVMDRDEAWSFITNLGVRMGTNFGFAFDSDTGVLYPEDDPRRK